MSIKLTNPQRAMLHAATQHDDPLVLPPKLKGRVAQKVAAKLIEANFVREIRAKPGMPVWRRDAEGDRSFALTLTAAGVKAVAELQPQGFVARQVAAPTDSVRKVTDSAQTPATLKSGRDTAPRDRSKLTGVVAMLSRNTAATIAELTDATGWMPHTTRAAITGLRKRGYVSRERVADGDSAYRITGAAEEDADAPDLAKARRAA